jgi:hypothetical protein
MLQLRLALYNIYKMLEIVNSIFCKHQISQMAHQSQEANIYRGVAYVSEGSG